ncbi:MAG: serine/threonine protein phosphatase [Microscillaceae bacterium]|nr:serine/threonine protein phosphatase [Microscillaceae bacterium]
MLHQKIIRPILGNRWVIADIHGCLKTLQALVAKLAIKPSDQLFFLGDYIDRGPDSARVVDFILDLEAQNNQVYALRGNHEQSLLEEWQFYSQTKLLKNLDTFIDTCDINNALNLLDENGRLKTKYEHFFKQLPYYFDLEDYYLVHAGFDFSCPIPLRAYEEMLWIRGFSEQNLSYQQTNQRRIVVGHSVHQLEQIKTFIQQKNLIIPLDNGCFYALYNPYEVQEGVYGHLCAFNLDTWELVVQPCLDEDN